MFGFAEIFYLFQTRAEISGAVQSLNQLLAAMLHMHHFKFKKFENNHHFTEKN